MKRTATLIAAAAIALAPLAPAAAAPAPRTPPPASHRVVVLPASLPVLDGIPLCVSTTWAKRHYGVPKTAPGASCFVRMHRDVLGQVLDNRGNGYAPAWYPRLWHVDGWITTSTGRPLGQIVTRPF